MTSSNNRIIPTDVEPDWMTPSLQKQLVQFAEDALPNEFCGLITVSREGAHGVHVFSGDHSPTSCYANEKELVEFCYELEKQSFEVRATVHSHPLGRAIFSKADGMLAMWAPLHLLLYRDEAKWQGVWGSTGSIGSIKVDNL